MKGKCILVFGVSGVDKTSACEAFIARHPEALFVSASGLLKSAKQTSGEALRTAQPHEIVDNQALLGQALAAFRQGRESQLVLVDAHGVIDNDHELVRVPVSAVRALEPDRLVLLEAPPKLIAERRAADLRKRPNRSLKAITRELVAEHDTVTAYADELGVALTIADAAATVSLEQLLGT